jgi:cobalt/nickel transport system permease protein
MHIPDGFLNHQVSAGMAAAAAGAVAHSFQKVRAELKVKVTVLQQQLATVGQGAIDGAKSWSISWSKQANQTIQKITSLSALIFSLQMLNFPVQNGTSGHFLGAALATFILGPYAAVLAMTMVVGTQAIFFADGGISALGANLINMAVLPVALSALLFRITNKPTVAKRIPTVLGLFVTAWLTIVFAAVSAAFELGISQTISFRLVLPAMVSVHMLIGIGEGIISLLVARFLFHGVWQVRTNQVPTDEK